MIDLEKLDALYRVYYAHVSADSKPQRIGEMTEEARGALQDLVVATLTGMEELLVLAKLGRSMTRCCRCHAEIGVPQAFIVCGDCGDAELEEHPPS